MTYNYYVKSFIEIFIIILSLLISLAILKVKPKGYKWLFLFLIFLITHVIIRLGIVQEIRFIFVYLSIILVPLSFFLGSTIFLYTNQVLFNKNHQNIIPHLIVPFLMFIVQLSLVIFRYDEMTIDAIKNLRGIHFYYTKFIGITMTLYIVSLLFLAVLKIKKYSKESQATMSSSNIQNSQILNVYTILTLLFFLFKGIVYLYSVINLGNIFLVIDDVVHLSILCLIIYQLISQPVMLPLIEDPEEKKKEKYSKVNLPESQRKEYAIILENYMNKEKAFLDNEISITKISQVLNIPKHFISMTLNIEFEKSFYHFVNMYRIRYAGELLKREDQKENSILNIAFDSGFQSKATFNKTFKSVYKMTPSEFRKHH